MKIREIKFNAWHKTKKRMLHDFTWMPTGSIDMGKGALLHYKSVNGSGLAGECELIKLEYIGLKDRTGLKIYDGDILKDRLGNIRDIHWDDKQAGWCSKCLSDTGSHPEFDHERISFGWIVTDKEIIGNRFENPELSK